MSDKLNSDGRKANAAQPLAERPGLVSSKGTERTGREERKTAGPDGPDATETSTASPNAGRQGPAADPAEGKR